MDDKDQIERIRSAMKIVAKLAAEDPIYEPIYESFERDLAELKASKSTKARMRRRLDLDTFI